MTSNPLESPEMISIDQQKARRRAQLAVLLKEIKPTQLVEMLEASGTPISAAMLYQMSQGTGKNMRHANDAQARDIERAAGKLPGWLDGVTGYDAAGERNALRETRETGKPSRGSAGWVAQLSAKQSALRQTLDFYLPAMSDQQAEALRQIILAMRVSNPDEAPVKAARKKQPISAPTEV